MPRALRPKLGPPPDGSWIGSRTTRLKREPTPSYAGNGRACRSLTARGGGFLWIEPGRDPQHRADGSEGRSRDASVPPASLPNLDHLSEPQGARRGGAARG